MASKVMNSQEALQHANSLFVDENFSEALSYYNLSVELDEKNTEALLKRSACYHKLGKLTDSIADANAVIKLHPDNSALSKAYLRKGIACFDMEEFETAKISFKNGLQIEPTNNSFKTWIRKCNSELEIDDDLETENSSKKTKSDEVPSTITPQSSSPIHPTQPPTQPSTSSVTNNQKPSNDQKLRHEWYQTATHVYVSLFVKNVKSEQARFEIKEKSINVVIKLSETNEFVFDVDLCDKIIPSESTTQILSTKIEIKLKKSNQAKWKTLEDSGENNVKPWDVTSSNPTSNPLPNINKKNWDQIAKEVEQDKNIDGEDGLNKLFKDIYGNATDEQRRAMVKSFTESGGTVLSTNWDEVGKGQVKGSPPDGMEMHQWSENK